MWFATFQNLKSRRGFVKENSDRMVIDFTDGGYSASYLHLVPPSGQPMPSTFINQKKEFFGRTM